MSFRAIENYTELIQPSASNIRVAYLSSYSPRACGIATFCEDLVKAIGDGLRGTPIILAMENGKEQYSYPPAVHKVINERHELEYEQAADYINSSPADLVCLQHEFGIFGGLEGFGLHRFFARLHKPVITTLHTVVPHPEPRMRAGIRELARHSQRLVVMNALATGLLQSDYGLAGEKIILIHHGAPPPALITRPELKARFGLQGRRVLSTFGLVGRGKGLERVIQALPEICRRYPETVYLIVGQTHPGARQQEKESYREELRELAKSLGVEGAIQFINKYLTKEEIKHYLGLSDIYVTPYLNPHQICSGTLAYALAAGKAIVSTPYLYARFLLDNGRGMLADFRNPAEIARAVNRIFDEPGLQGRLEARALAYGKQLLWPEVGAQYRSLFQSVLQRQYSSFSEQRAPTISAVA